MTFSSAAGTKGITVTCADSGWITSAGSPAWCSMRKGSNSTATISVTKNTGGKRTTGCNCVNGSKVATVFVTQEGETVTYDRSSMIMLLKQGQGNCAVVCAAMCVKKTIDELSSAGCNTLFAYWGDIGEKFGYNVYPSNAPADATLQKIYEVLKSGYPVIVKINDNTNNQIEHWVVVTKYTGSGSNFSKYDFTCADPISGTFVPLSQATNYDKPFLYLYYVKQ